MPAATGTPEESLMNSSYPIYVLADVCGFLEELAGEEVKHLFALAAESACSSHLPLFLLESNDPALLVLPKKNRTRMSLPTTDIPPIYVPSTTQII
jgi:hypothetical protein